MLKCKMSKPRHLKQQQSKKSPPFRKATIIELDDLVSPPRASTSAVPSVQVKPIELPTPRTNELFKLDELEQFIPLAPTVPSEKRQRRQLDPAHEAHLTNFVEACNAFKVAYKENIDLLASERELRRDDQTALAVARASHLQALGNLVEQRARFTTFLAEHIAIKNKQDHVQEQAQKTLENAKTLQEKIEDQKVVIKKAEEETNTQKNINASLQSELHANKVARADRDSKAAKARKTLETVESEARDVEDSLHSIKMRAQVLLVSLRRAA